MSERLVFRPNTEASRHLVEWWQALDGDRAGRALLRRCRSYDDVAFVPAYHQLLHRLESADLRVWRPALAAVAGIAARVRVNEAGESLPRQMAAPGATGSGPRVSDLRFARLMATGGLADLFPRLGRIVTMLHGSANLVGVAEGMYDWSPWLRRRWAYDYYAVAPRSAAKEE